jgi:hypothetical protein
LRETLRQRGERNERGDSADAKDFAKLHLLPPDRAFVSGQSRRLRLYQRMIGHHTRTCV